MRNKVGICLVGFLLVFSFGCSKLTSLGGKVNLFEGDNVVQAIAKIKEKVGATTFNVASVDIYPDRMLVEIQSPKNPKDTDKYTFANGSVTGPEPVQTTKYAPESIDAVDWTQIPAIVQQSIAASKLEGGSVTHMTLDLQQPYNAHPELRDVVDADKEAKRKQCYTSPDPTGCLYFLDRPLVLTWRIFVEGPRGRKDFWADKSGKLNEKSF